MNSSANKEAAMALASLGLRVFPCNPDKTPMVAAWEQVAMSPFAVEAKWGTSPAALPAIAVGAQGFVVFDADRRPRGADGVEAFHSLCAFHSIDLSNAFVVETPSGGRHFYFRTDQRFVGQVGKLAQAVDIRSHGNYVIAPGATLPDGRSYRIIAGSWDAIPPLPGALADLLREKRPPAAQKPHGEAQALAVTGRERAFAEAALEDEVATLSVMRKGSGRNHQLNIAAHSLGTMARWIDLNTVMRELLTVMRVNGWISGNSEREAIATIDSGWNAGMLKPRPLLTPDTNDPVYKNVCQWIAREVAAFKRKQAEAKLSKRNLSVIQGADIHEQPVTWLWEGYLPCGKLTLLAGAGGTGKSTIAFNIGATITNAGAWPDGSRCKTPGNVLIWSSEDDPADTIKPRMMAVGANDRRYGIISGTVDETGLRSPFDSAKDMDSLRSWVNSIGGVSLLIIDPIVTAVTGDMHKANDVRRDLQAIVDFAAEMNCAVLGITHFAKGTAGKNSAERVIGSQAFAALARMVLVAAKEEESNRRVFTRAKSNNSIDTGGFSYSIEAITLHHGIEATRVVWGEQLEGSSRSILSDIEGETPGESGSKLAIAKAFLSDLLKNGPVASTEVFEHGRESQDIKRDTMIRAQKALQIVPRKLALNGGWVWEMPTVPGR